MADTDSLYRELKGDLETVAEPLFDFACQQVKQRGAFLPVGSKLSIDGETGLVAAAPDDEVTSSDIVLPLLVAALTKSATGAVAVALCEWVKIEGGRRKANRCRQSTRTAQAWPFSCFLYPRHKVVIPGLAVR
jgi:hypothetical protein